MAGGGKKQGTRCVHPLQGCHGDMIRDGRAQRGRLLWVGLLAYACVRPDLKAQRTRIGAAT